MNFLKIMLLPKTPYTLQPPLRRHNITLYYAILYFIYLFIFYFSLFFKKIMGPTEYVRVRAHI